jgi:PAS domain-containing protein
MGTAAHRAARHRQGSGVQLLIDAIPTLVWSAHSDGSADFSNQRRLEYTGLSVDQALDWGWKVPVHPDNLDGASTLLCGVKQSVLLIQRHQPIHSE